MKHSLLDENCKRGPFIGLLCSSHVQRDRVFDPSRATSTERMATFKPLPSRIPNHAKGKTSFDRKCNASSEKKYKMIAIVPLLFRSFDILK